MMVNTALNLQIAILEFLIVKKVLFSIVKFRIFILSRIFEENIVGYTITIFNKETKVL